MAPPHRQDNRNHRDDRNRSRSRTSRAQAGGSQNEDVAAAQRAVDQAMERQRQAQRGVDEAMKWQRQVQRELSRLEHRANSQRRSHRIPSVASNRNTSFRQGRRPTGINKPQQSSSVGQDFTMNLGSEAERRDFVNTHHGPGGMGAVNKPLSGEQRRSYRFPPNRTGSMEGVTDDTDELKAVGEHVLKVNKGAYLSYHVEPRRHDAKSFMENEEVLVRVTSSNGRTKQGKVATLGEPSRFTEISRRPDIECVNCRLKTHTLRHCLDADSEDQIYGCILCNKENHFVDECHRFQSMSLKEQVELMVFERANMPRLAVSKQFPKWYDLLEQAISSGDIDANGPMKGFPWTGQFCLDLCYEKGGDTIRALQKEFDESGFDTSILRVDPNTDSLQQVRLYYADQPQASGAPGPSSSGGHVHQDDPRDLRHARDGQFGPLAPRQAKPASGAQ
ncbi:hypothetical protein FNYG_07141 [Fusarium nygamai]|uniref:Uncharacterized protein n=1 Tax=Gibberella nygamai TaxID=42673 RepID=A0A2K0WB59_GIBNY|nr:hypothetical protein FNYG_07141 [Fusarium nygamai]